MKLVRIATVAVLIQAAAILSGAAQDYPVRDIRVLSGQAAGSGANSIVRFFAEMLRRKLNRNVIVENKPGILGSFAGEALARAPADGYTIFISGYPAVSSNQLLFAKLSYNPVTDFAPVTTLVSQPFVLVVSPKSPATTVQELTAHLKAKADRASYGSSNSSGVALSELYKSAMGLTTVQVPYRSSSEIMRDMVRGEIDFAFFDFGLFRPANSRREYSWTRGQFCEPVIGSAGASNDGRSRCPGRANRVLVCGVRTRRHAIAHRAAAQLDVC